MCPCWSQEVGSTDQPQHYALKQQTSPGILKLVGVQTFRLELTSHLTPASGAMCMRPAYPVVCIMQVQPDLQGEDTQSRMWLDAGPRRLLSSWTRRSLQTCPQMTTMSTLHRTSGAAAMLPGRASDTQAVSVRPALQLRAHNTCLHVLALAAVC